IGAGAHVEVVHGDAQLNKENMKCYFKILAKLRRDRSTPPFIFALSNHRLLISLNEMRPARWIVSISHTYFPTKFC
ncbi:MAG: hypothetical protein II603_09460, partial [Muribaculaceae bacterium]|nr:hypothetical protein [Muribaculaceae bacterium]